MYDVILILCLILAAALAGFILKTTCARLTFQIYPSSHHTVQVEGCLSRKTFAYGIVRRQLSLGNSFHKLRCALLAQHGEKLV